MLSKEEREAQSRRIEDYCLRHDLCIQEVIDLAYAALLDREALDHPLDVEPEAKQEFEPYETGLRVGFTARTTQIPSCGWLRDIPIPAQDAYVHARGLRPRRARICLAISTHPVLPSALPTASAP